MTTRQTIGAVLGFTGVFINLSHPVVMMIFGITERYHGFLTWMLLGLVMTVVGLVLLSNREPHDR